MSMEKEIVERAVYHKPWDFSGSLESLIERLQKASKDYSEYPNLHFEKQYWQSHSGMVYILFGSREETEDEYMDRITAEEKYQQGIEEDERKLYEKLKEKYGDVE